MPSVTRLEKTVELKEFSEMTVTFEAVMESVTIEMSRVERKYLSMAPSLKSMLFSDKSNSFVGQSSHSSC
jgi:hypothetical protein